jgi:hypothetical protein
MQHEVKPLGTLFDGTGLGDGGFSDTGSDGVNIFARLVSGLAPGTPYHWRIRARYDIASVPFQEYSHWIHIPRNGWNEADLRTAAPPPATGACCYADRSCSVQTQVACAGAGGTYQGDKVGCSAGLCDIMTGACCYAGGDCDNALTLPQCLEQGGEYQGNSSLCSGVSCPQPCPADCADPQDDLVNVSDLLDLLAEWGGSGGCDVAPAPAGDGVVDVSDLLLLLGNWGTCP